MKKRKLIWPWEIVIYALMVCFIFYVCNPFQLYFLNDDFIHVQLSNYFQFRQHNGLRQVNEMSFYLDSLWTGKNATGYHAINLLIHLLDIFLFALLIKKIAKTLDIDLPKPLVVLALVLFGVYGFHSEAILWVIARVAILSFFFCALSWLFLIKSATSKWAIFPCIVCFLLGLFTYETTWMYPLWILLWWYLIKKDSIYKKGTLLAGIIIWLCFIIYFPVRILITGQLWGQYEAGKIIERNYAAMASAIMKLFFRSFLPPMLNTKLFLFCCGLVIVLLVFLLFKMIKQKKLDKLWWLLLFCWIVSYTPFISLGMGATVLESERYLYFPSAFLCVFLLYSLWLVFKNKTMFYGISVLIIGYNAICFYNAGKAYKEAGSIVKNTMYQLSTTAYAGCVELNNVPETWKGIPIFRLGFIDGIKWILGDGTAEKITFKSFLKTSPAFPVLQFHAINKSDPSICISGDFVPTK